jgi:hypothetical protein
MQSTEGSREGSDAADHASYVLHSRGINCYNLHPCPTVSLHHLVIYLISQRMWKPVLCKLYIVVKYIFLPQCHYNFFFCWNTFLITVFVPKISSFRIASSSSSCRRYTVYGRGLLAILMPSSSSSSLFFIYLFIFFFFNPLANY